jgi:hypothetical protein
MFIMIKTSGDMNLAVRIHLNCWEFILVGLECQYKQKGAVQTEPPPPEKIKQYFKSSRGVKTFFSIGKNKRAAHWNCP